MDLFEEVRALEIKIDKLKALLKKGQVCLAAQRLEIERNNKIIEAQNIEIQKNFEPQVN